MRYDAGRLSPMDCFLVWENPQPIHRDLTYWKQSDDFLSERWLLKPDDPLFYVKGGWRPFEHGPRNRIGQELAMLEIKTLRNYKIDLMYEDLQSAKRIRTVYGQRCYQLQRAQPSDDLP